MVLIKKKFGLSQFKQDKYIPISKYKLQIAVGFDAAHRLSDYHGECKRIHGHFYKIIVTIASTKLNEWGAVIDFKDFKRLIKRHITEKYDHKLILKNRDKLNNRLDKVLPKSWIVWMNDNPTAENLAKDIYKNLLPMFKIRKGKIKLVSVAVFETSTSSAIYNEIKS